MHKDKAGRLERPCWGRADPRASFARGFGAIHTRTKSGSGFIGENYYADCNALVKYPCQLFTKPLHGHSKQILAYPFYRRFYFDGDFAGRFEFGFRLNEASIDDIEKSLPSAEYDVVEISKQILTREVMVHILDHRVIKCDFYKASIPLRDGYILSSTKNGSIKKYDIELVGSSYVSVGAPFVFIRASSNTRILRVKQRRDLIDSQNKSFFITRSGVHNQSFDTIVLASSRNLDSESAQERLARLFYSQMRALSFAHSFYLRKVDERKIAGPNHLAPAVEALVERLKALTPLDGNVDDRDTCETMREILRNADIDISALVREIDRSLKPRPATKLISRVFSYSGKIFRYFDKKADKAIEAAASTATKHILTGGL